MIVEHMIPTKEVYSHNNCFKNFAVKIMFVLTGGPRLLCVPSESCGFDSIKLNYFEK